MTVPTPEPQTGVPGTPGNPGNVPASPPTTAPPVPPQPPVPPVPGHPAPAPSGPFFSSEDLEKVRKEEKDKLYGELAKTKEVVKELKSERDARVKAEEEARVAAQESLRRQEEEELSLRDLLKKRDEEFKTWQTKVEADREAERAILQKERDFAALSAYINQRVGEERTNESIAPELLDLVTGNTPDEVEQSIVTLRAKTQAILENVQSARTASAAQMRGVSTAGYAVSGPMDIDSGHKTYSNDELKAMPMADWAKLRGQVLPSVNGRSEQGMFGH